jgi:DnaJ-class molecular chaperone
MDPYAFLGLPDLASPDEIRVAYRDKARLLHPDGGGSLAGFQTLKDARDEALGTSRTAPCPGCGGRGSRAVVSGFTAIEIQCGVCLGAKLMWPYG